MDFPQSCYYKECKVLLSVVGHWPFQSQKSNRFRRYILWLLLINSVFCQFSAIVTSNFDLLMTLDVLPPLSAVTTCLILTIYFTINITNGKELLLRVKEDWLSDRLDEETKIKEAFAVEIQFLLRLLLVLIIILGTTILTIALFMSEILDYFDPLNETRAHIFVVPEEFFFIDEQKYYYPIMIRTYLIIMGVFFFGLGNHFLICSLMQHAYGMFTIIGYRLENAIPRSILQSKPTINDLNQIYHDSIILCIKRHQKAIEFANVMGDYYAKPFMSLILALLLIMSPTFFQLSNFNSLQYQTILQLVLSVGFLFVLNFLGQRLLDLSESVAEKAYFSPWYIVSPKLQKFIILIIQRCDIPCTMKAYNIYVVSMDFFRMVLQIGISYCMTLRRLQQ